MLRPVFVLACNMLLVVLAAVTLTLVTVVGATLWPVFGSIMLVLTVTVIHTERKLKR